MMARMVQSAQFIVSRQSRKQRAFYQSMQPNPMTNSLCREADNHAIQRVVRLEPRLQRFKA